MPTPLPTDGFQSPVAGMAVQAVRNGTAGEAGQARRDNLSIGAGCPWSLRRLKEDLKDLNGHRLFPDRHVHTVSFNLGPQEFVIYNVYRARIQSAVPSQAFPPVRLPRVACRQAAKRV